MTIEYVKEMNSLDDVEVTHVEVTQFLIFPTNTKSSSEIQLMKKQVQSFLGFP